MTTVVTEKSKYFGYEKAADAEEAVSDASSFKSETTSCQQEILPQGAKSRIDARFISDAIIGLSDGMTVPFALTAGLSAIGDTRIVIFGGFAELIAGAISMGLGGYLGAKSEEDSYRATLTETQNEASSSPFTTNTKISQIFSTYDLPQPLIQELTAHISQSSKLSAFLMRFEHAIPEPAPARAINCALTIALGYFIGGFIPLLPYLFVARDQVSEALVASIVIMVVALFAFGYSKTCFVSGWRGTSSTWMGAKGGAQMVVVGGLAAGSAMGLVKVFDSFPVN